MLELKRIKKTYELGKKKDKNYQKVEALKGVSLKFRESEFVSILGQSGCGKTTLLNIIGGLDKYTSGDLIINGKSTKDFTDKDWDTYRNHSVGFVFQSYNLIPHQTVLQNVEIALTLSGIGKEERRNRAVKVLERVGLSDKINAKPNQLSGGQMQRVAIARALVNNPDVILADEPTGALDSKTSIQIMELLKEISKEKLIVMVTHNPDIAEEYSTRIIKLKDGELVSDSKPITEEEIQPKKTKASEKIAKKTNMSFISALSLSFKNLLTKKARTTMVAIAGSIGIIGIALILALSSGFQAYINRVQEDTLSHYPLSIYESSIDATSMMMTMFMPSGESVENPDGHVYSADTMTNLFDSFSKSMQKNDLESFKEYIDEHYDEIKPYVNDVQYTYNFDFEVKNADGENVDPGNTSLYDMMISYSVCYLENNARVEVTKNEDKTFTVTNKKKTNYDFVKNYLGAEAEAVLRAGNPLIMTEAQVVKIIANLVGGSQMEDMIKGYNTPFVSYGTFSEMIDNQALLKEQYDLLGDSKWATESNEVMLVLGEDNEIDDYVLYSLGLITKEEVEASIESAFTEDKVVHKLDYDDILGKEYKVLTKVDYYIDDGTELVYIKDNFGYIKEEYKDEYSALIADEKVGKTIKIVGICKLKEDIASGSLDSTVVYTKEFTNEMISYYNDSAAVDQGKVDPISLTPNTIRFFPKSFESKQEIINFIDKYNDQADDMQEISYTDTVGLLMESVSTIISAISYVLIGFVSVSLVVSSIMIGIITYISVLERIKEIGILRAVGASKKDIKRVFTAETFIIGFVAGVLGIVITLLLTIPVNLIISSLTGISGVAKLPVAAGFILVGISMMLTIIAGLIPARIASKKDPVIALRSE